MRFWYEMTNKYGFEDGDAVPVEAEACRNLYIEAVNLLAEKHGSAVRAIAYNRGGYHNPCMISFYVQADETKLVEAHEDEAMLQAIDDAHELELDGFIQVEVKRSDDIHKLWEQINNGL